MAKIACPNCRMSGKISGHPLPPQVRCSGCRTRFDPAQHLVDESSKPPEADLTALAFEEEQAPPVHRPPGPAIMTVADDRIRFRDLEPWYYVHLERWGNFWKTAVDLGAILAAAALVALVGFELLQGTPGRVGPGEFGAPGFRERLLISPGILGMGALFIGLCWFFNRVTAATILIWVDVARNIRRARIALESIR